MARNSLKFAWFRVDARSCRIALSSRESRKFHCTRSENVRIAQNLLGSRSIVGFGVSTIDLLKQHVLSKSEQISIIDYNN